MYCVIGTVIFGVPLFLRQYIEVACVMVLLVRQIFLPFFPYDIVVDVLVTYEDSFNSSWDLQSDWSGCWSVTTVTEYIYKGFVIK